MKPKEQYLCTYPSRKIAVKVRVQIVQFANIFRRTGIGGVSITLPLPMSVTTAESNLDQGGKKYYHGKNRGK